jgi:hypothetical protein
MSINRVGQGETLKSQLFVDMLVFGRLNRFQVDTGAMCNVTRQDLPTGVEVLPARQVLLMYNGQKSSH